MFGPRCRGIEHFLLTILDHLPDVELIINVFDWPKVRTLLYTMEPSNLYMDNSLIRMLQAVCPNGVCNRQVPLYIIVNLNGQ